MVGEHMVELMVVECMGEDIEERMEYTVDTETTGGMEVVQEGGYGNG